MCNYHIIHHNEHGYIVKCKGCARLKLAFGTTSLSMDEDEFYDFKQVTEHYYELQRDCECRTYKQVQIPTATKSITLVYTIEEIERLISLMDEAYINMEVQKLLAE
jgi:hypothetical protein